MARNTGVKRLTGIQDYKLMQLVEKHYTEKKITDEEFAKWATGELGFFLNRDHVYKRRTELGIQASRVMNFTKKNDCEALLEMVSALEQRIITLEKLTVNRIAVK
jgi:hydroxyacyl-ACP dehydratase HTD2-like protein with hotdog domain